MKHGILLHSATDDVGVTIMDLSSGAEVGTVTLDGDPVGSILLVNDVPLSHKVAVRDIPAGKDVIEYERAIGSAIQDIPAGSHVHVHNIKTRRW